MQGCEEQGLDVRVVDSWVAKKIQAADPYRLAERLHSVLPPGTNMFRQAIIRGAWRRAPGTCPTSTGSSSPEALIEMP